MELILKSIHLVNFKGARDEFYELEKESDIYGDNATGKTTIQDAYSWLLFDKDSTDRKEFEIMPLDSRGKFIKKIDTSVEAVFIIDGSLTTIKKTLRQKWQKTRGESESTYKGTETVCEWDGVPMSVTEYRSKVNSVIAENIFKLLTNTENFSSLKWQDQRVTLLAIAGEISNEDIASGDSDFEAFLKDVGKNKIEDWKKKKYAEKKKIKDELELIPTRIDEANRALISLPTSEELSGFENQLTNLKADFELVESGLLSEAEAAKEQNRVILGKQQEIHNLRSDIATIEHNMRSSLQRGKLDRDAEISSKTRNLQNMDKELNDYNALLDSKKRRVESETTEQTKLRAQWAEINKEQYKAPAPLVFNDEDFCCPTCKRAIEANDIEAKKSEMVSKFNANNDRLEKEFNATKTRKLEANKSRGLELKTSIEKLNGEISDLKDNIKNNEECIAELKSELGQLILDNRSATENESSTILTSIANSPEISINKNKIAALEQECIVVPNKTVEELKEKKAVLVIKIDALKSQLSGKDQIKSLKLRIEQLTAQERKMAAEVAELEGQEFTAERFIKAQMSELENRINGRFSLVKFQMFDTQVNGAEVETCKTLINTNGSFVPITDANNAAKINAGLDIIRVLSNHYGISAPIFVDNAESVVRLLPVESQVIRLIVSASDKKLRIHNKNLEAVA